MKLYKDLDNNSNIEAYRYNDKGIMVRFKNGTEKEYEEDKVTFYELDCLKQHADSGRGLDEYMEELEESKQ